MLRALLLLTACTPAPPPPPMTVFYAGCEAVDPDGTCETDGELTLWVADPAAVAEVRLDDAPLAVRPEPAAGGARWRLPAPAAPGTLTVTPADPAAAAPWKLAVRPRDLHPVLAAARDKQRAGDFDGALQTLQAAAPKLTGTAVEGPLRSAQARARYALGQEEEAVAELDRAAAAHAATGRTYAQVRDLCLMAYILVQRGDLAEAREAAARVPRTTPQNLDVAYLVAYHEGILSTLAGDYRAALEEMGRAAAVADQLGHPGKSSFAMGRVSDTLLRLGRFQEAVDTFEAILDQIEPSDACPRAHAQANLAWMVLRSREERPGSMPERDPVALLQGAVATLEGCPEAPRERDSARLNLALAQVQAGDLDAAGAGLAALGALETIPEAEDRLWATDAAARVALGQGRPSEARRLREQQRADARAAFHLEMERRAARGLADALVVLGQPEAALAAYAAAAEVGRQHAALAPAQAGRDGFLHQQAGTAAAHVALLLRLDRPAEALAVLRRFRAAFVRSQAIAARVADLPAAERARWQAVQADYARLRQQAAALGADAWTLSPEDLALAQRRRDALADQAQALLDGMLGGVGAPDAPLRAPADGELLLAWMPVAGGVAGFAATAEGIRGGLLADPGLTAPPAAQAEAWLAPFSAELAAAARVTLLPAGALRAVDFAALPWGARPLGAAVPLAWSLDLPARPSRPGPPADALVIGDPGSDLPAARQEAAAVAARLAGRAVSVTHLAGAQAGRAEALAALGSADLLHYAGHGEAAASAWDSALVLADGARLTAADALASPSVPRRVVLSSCETAATADTAVEGLGVAQAFVVAGADAVIGATRPVPDAVAATFATSLYSGPLDADPAAAFHNAVVAARAAHPEDPAWSAFRLLLP